jgi:hypothetical protein
LSLILRSKSREALKILIDDSHNLLLYINDVMSYGMSIVPVLSNAILYYAVCPVLISSVCSSTSPVIGINTGIYLLTQFCSVITYRPILEAIAQIIFLPNQGKEIIYLVEKYPISVPQYFFTWTANEDLRASTFMECKFSIRSFRCVIKL